MAPNGYPSLDALDCTLVAAQERKSGVEEDAWRTVEALMAAVVSRKFIFLCGQRALRVYRRTQGRVRVNWTAGVSESPP